MDRIQKDHIIPLLNMEGAISPTSKTVHLHRGRRFLSVKIPTQTG